MKNLVLTGIFLSLIAVSCSGDKTIISETHEPVLRLTGVGPCEPNTIRQTSPTRLMDVFSPKFGSLDRLEVVIQQNRASFTHRGATMNCCMDSLGLALKREGNLFRVMETEHTAHKCDCLCGYTVYGEILGLPSGACTIEVWNTAAAERVLCAARVIIP